MKLLLSLILLATTGFAQQADPFIREHKLKRAQNPEGLLFTIRLKDNRKQFQQGEVITLELSFASSKPDMQNAINSSEQPVTSTFLSTLALLEFARQAPAVRTYPAGDEEQVSEYIEPSTGRESLNKVLAARVKGYPRCYESALKDVAKLHMSADVEEIATAALEDEGSNVVSQAAGVLGEYVSADAEKALWKRLEKWREATQSRSEDASENRWLC